MARCFFYGRVSTADQLDSPKIQEDQCLAYYNYRLAKEGYELGGMFCDLGVSGGSPFATRPQGALLSRHLEEGDIVVFSKLDRGFRNLMDMLQTFATWDARGVKIVFLDLQIDTSTPMGRVFIKFSATIAEFERERLGQRMREFRAKRNAEGRPTGKPPYGYKLVGPKGKRDFVKDPEQRRVGRLILHWRCADYTWDKIYLCLIKRGERQRNGREYSYGTIFNYARAEAKLIATEMQRAGARP